MKAFILSTNMWICIRCTFENTDQVFKCQVKFNLKREFREKGEIRRLNFGVRFGIHVNFNYFGMFHQ